MKRDKARKVDAGLIGVAKRWRVSLDSRIETEPVRRRDDEVTCRSDACPSDQPRVEIGGEEDRSRKTVAQCVEDQEFVVRIAPQHADRAYAVATLALLVPIEVGQLLREPPEV